MQKSHIAIALLAICTTGAYSQDSQPTKSVGNIGLEEIKPTMSLDLIESQTRIFKIKGSIKRTSTGNPKIAEPVVVDEHEFVIQPKSPGKTTLAIWDNNGNTAVIELNVKKSTTANSERDSSATQVPPAKGGTLTLEENKTKGAAEARLSKLRQ